MATPIAEISRRKLFDNSASGVSAWKANDAAETVILLVRVSTVDPNNFSVYAMDKLGNATYLGTTGLGKDGTIGSVVVYSDGTVALIYAEAETPDTPGANGDVYLVKMQYKLSGAVATGGTDTYARSLITALTTRVSALESTAIAHSTQLTGLTGRVAGLERADVLDGQRHTALVAQVNALAAEVTALKNRPAVVAIDQTARDGVTAINAKLAKVKAAL